MRQSQLITERRAKARCRLGLIDRLQPIWQPIDPVERSLSFPSHTHPLHVCWFILWRERESAGSKAAFSSLKQTCSSEQWKSGSRGGKSRRRLAASPYSLSLNAPWLLSHIPQGQKLRQAAAKIPIIGKINGERDKFRWAPTGAQQRLVSHE